MSDYTQITDFSVKDGLTTGDPEKIVLGADFDAEFAAISTAVASKYDSDDIASEAQAEALLLDTVLITPLQVGNILQDNAGMAYDIQALADPNVDTLLGWDDSASAVIGFTMGTGLSFNLTTIELDHLGIEDLTDPGADRIMFWDDTAGVMTWLSLGADLSISGTTLGVVDTALTITESQISDLGTYYESGDTVPALTITTLTAPTATITTLNVGNADTSITRDAAGQIAVEGDAVLTHDDGSFTSAKVFFSNGTEPTTEGSNGDIFLVY